MIYFSKMSNLLLLLLVVGTVSGYKSYSGYQVLRVSVSCEREVDEVKKLEADDTFEVLTEKVDKFVDVLVAPENILAATTLLRVKSLEHEVVVGDVGAVFKGEQEAMLHAPGVDPGDYSYDQYHRLAVMYAHLDSLVAQFPDQAATFNLPGETHEGRKIQVIRITNNIADPASDLKPLIWLDGCIHAREWVSPATVMFITDSLLGLEEPGKAAEMSALLDKYQFHIAPCINPDGYEYSHTTDRMWRKTRAPAGCQYNQQNWWGGCRYRFCYGIDPNRNWSADWGRVGVSDNPCGQTYPGKAPFDQKNTAMVRDYLTSVEDKLVLFVTYHSYSQLFLTPLGYTLELPPNHDHHVVVGAAVVGAIYGVHGATYTPQQSAGLYPASGDSADWAHEVLHKTDSYTFELRPDPSSPFGFKLPAEQIRETGEENVSGLLALIANIDYNNNTI